MDFYINFIFSGNEYPPLYPFFLFVSFVCVFEFLCFFVVVVLLLLFFFWEGGSVFIMSYLCQQDLV